MEKPETSPPYPFASENTPPPSISPTMQRVWLECRESYLVRVAAIEQAMRASQIGELTLELQHQAEREAHTLVGSLGSFGLDAACELSRQIEQILKQKTPLEQSDPIQLNELLLKLRQALGEESVGGKTIESEESFGSPLSCPHPSLPTILIVDDDLTLANLLATEAIPWGLQTSTASNLAQARQQMEQQLPSVVLLDLNLSESGESGLGFLAELQNRYPHLPVLVFTASDSLSDRVQAARWGCQGFFQKPIAPSQVLGMIAQTLQQSQPKRSKLLVVDDDRDLLVLLQQILEPEGYDLTLLENPQRFWEVLEQTAPDLLLLDVAFSGGATLGSSPTEDLNGFDLCQIIRNDPHWGKLPVLFLSASTEAETVRRGFEVGADDFLHKPISEVELLTRVRKRLEQGQVRRQSEVDELTGVGNRRKSLQDLTRLLRLADRQKHPLSLAILDLDRFKQVNDRYGHEMGDRVLNYFGNLLKQSFRLEDVVGRWGGEEFVVGLYGMSKFDGVKRLTEILQRLQQETFTTGDGRVLQVTFSGGIAQLVEDGTDLQALYRAADAALYRAKAAGRRQVLPARVQEDSHERPE